MKKKTGTGRSEAPASELETRTLRRQSCRVEFHRGFSSSIDGLPEEDRDVIVPELQEFMADWRDATTDSALYALWEYKAIQGFEDARKYQVRQIRLGKARRFRVFLTVLPGNPPIVWFLEVVRRDKNQSDKARERAIRRAKTEWERLG